MSARIFPLFVLFALAACGSGDPAGPGDDGGGGSPGVVTVGSVTLDQTVLALNPGGSAQLSATVRATTGVVLTDRTVTWSSSAASVATVTQQGRVTAATPGSATITATSDGKSATATVVVTPEAVQSIELTIPNATIQVGATATITATTKSASGGVLTGRTITWSSSAPDIATVANGTITGVAVGEATITASSEGKSASAVVTVVPVPVASVSITPASLSLELRKTGTLTATTKAADGSTLTGRTVTWESADAAIATVTAAGVVTGVAVGATQVTATSEGRSASVTVTITPIPVATIEITPATGSIGVGATLSITAVTKAANGEVLTGRDINWASDDPIIATVALGIVTGVSAGSTAIRASSEGATASATVVVKPKVSVSDGNRRLAVGSWNVCGIVYGYTWCWGAGEFGSLGNGSVIHGTPAPQIVGSGMAFTSIAGGNTYACALKENGEAWCWGQGALGILGNGSDVNKATPDRVLTDIRFRQISASGLERLTCAIALDYSAWCWGSNAGGGLGANTAAAASYVPTAVSGGHSYMHVSVGANHACALTLEGAAWCWGSNTKGQLGTGNTESRNAPVKVTGDHRFTEIASGYTSTCAIDEEGAAWCWGSNNLGELGTGALAASNVPVPVAGGHRFRSITAGGGNGVCALGEDGAAWCWGSGTSGRNGNGSYANQLQPVAVMGGHTFEQLVSGPYNVCGLVTEEIYCWGNNSVGQLGANAPAGVSNVPHWVAFAM